MAKHMLDRAHTRSGAFIALTEAVDGSVESFDRHRRTPIEGRVALMVQHLASSLVVSGWWLGLRIGEEVSTVRSRGSLAGMTVGPRWAMADLGRRHRLMVRAYDHDSHEWVLALDVDDAALAAYELEPTVVALLLAAIGVSRPALSGAAIADTA